MQFKIRRDCSNICPPPAVIFGRACALPASSRGPRVVLLGHVVKALLSLVKCLLFAIIVSSVLIIIIIIIIILSLLLALGSQVNTVQKIFKNAKKGRSSCFAR